MNGKTLRVLCASVGAAGAIALGPGSAQAAERCVDPVFADPTASILCTEFHGHREYRIVIGCVDASNNVYEVTGPWAWIGARAHASCAPGDLVGAIVRIEGGR